MFKFCQALYMATLASGALSLAYLILVARPGTAIKEELDAQASALILHHLQTKAELITSEFNTQGLVTVKNAKTLLGFESQNQLVYQGLGKVSAGVDLKQMNSQSVLVRGNQACLAIPPAEILDVEIEVLQDKVHFQPGILRADSLEMLKEAQLEFLQRIHQEAQQSGVVDKANEEAKRWVEEVVSPLMPSYQLTVTHHEEECFK